MYISCILPDSVAGRDGRLRQGDQILQVNGRDVSTRDETEQLFAQDRNAVTLLVSRCLLYGDEADEADDADPRHGCYDGEGNDAELEDEEDEEEDEEEDDDLLLATYQNCQQPPAQQPQQLPSNGGVAEKVSPALRLHPPGWPIGAALDHTSIKAHLDSVNMEISALDTRMENLLLHKSSGGGGSRSREAAADAADESVYRHPIDATATTNGHHHYHQQQHHTSTGKTRLHTGSSGRGQHQQQLMASLPTAAGAASGGTTRSLMAHRNQPVFHSSK